MGKPIRKVAVLGAGVMGSGIAAHCANAGLPVLLLDIVPRDLADADKGKKSARLGRVARLIGGQGLANRLKHHIGFQLVGFSGLQNVAVRTRFSDLKFNTGYPAVLA